MDAPDTKRLAEEAYNAYAAQAEWTAADGRPIPEWAHAGRAVQERWHAVVRLLAYRLNEQLHRAA